MRMAGSPPVWVLPRSQMCSRCGDPDVLSIFARGTGWGVSGPEAWQDTREWKGAERGGRPCTRQGHPLPPRRTPAGPAPPGTHIFCRQWAAVSTKRGWIKVPPQKWLPRSLPSCSEAMKGCECGWASRPPTISAAWPEPAGTTRVGAWSRCLALCPQPKAPECTTRRLRTPGRRGAGVSLPGVPGISSTYGEL